MTALTLQIGQALGIRPEGEGPAPVLVGGGFEVFFFYGGLSREEVSGFATGAVSCGVYVEDAIPVLVLDIEGFGGLEVAFNIFVEPEEKRRVFFESNPTGGTASIVLCDHPGAVVQAVRHIRPGAQTISEIKKACFDQLCLYKTIGQGFQAMRRIYDSISPEQMRTLTPMRPA